MGLKVLVADDNRDAAESLGMLLSIAGHSILLAHSGADALRIALNERPHVLVLDIGMPELSGYQVARAIRNEEWGRQALLLAISGWDQREDREASRAAGFDVHLSKPAQPEQIEALLAQFLKQRQDRFAPLSPAAELAAAPQVAGIADLDLGS